MATPNGRGKPQPNHDQDRQCNIENGSRRLGVPQREGFPARNDANSVFYPDSEGRNKTGAWATPGGQATPGGIHRRLKELHKAWLSLIESQQQQLEVSLRESKQLTAEMQYLQALLAETLEDASEE
ncbi:hypothetical protein NIES4103_31430 [Nostoc sp. NIES-4103]|nr:hypothetical protein NIES4103_31430 [Nostoc sp. NIES-4103]